jgi:hypothetical protein
MEVRAMTDATTQHEAMTQAAGKTLEAMNLWAETNQRIMRELVELGTGTARESIRMYADMQRGAIEAMRESQAAALRWQSGWREMASDPAAWYRKLMAETVQGAQQAFRVAEENAVAMTRAAERLQAATESAGKGIQDSCSTAVNKLKDIYAAA